MKNSWLSFEIPDRVREILHELAQQISLKFKFTPMNYSDLHMTAIFFGKQFKQKDMEIINNIIKKHNLSGSMIIDQLIFFPPSKKNLIVVRFITDDNIKCSLKNIRNDIVSKLGYNIADEEFIPHITLGKINLTTKELDTVIASDPLKNMIKKDTYTSDSSLNFEVSKDSPLYLCGNC